MGATDFQDILKTNRHFFFLNLKSIQHSTVSFILALYLQETLPDGESDSENLEDLYSTNFSLHICILGATVFTSPFVFKSYCILGAECQLTLISVNSTFACSTEFHCCCCWHISQQCPLFSFMMLINEQLTNVRIIYNK